MTITATDIETALNAWGDGLIAIATANDDQGIDEAVAVGRQVIEDLYDYDHGPVLFKPTMASGDQTFRTTDDGALSYFVANDPTYPLDGGFGLKGWREFSFDTASSFIDGDVALWMGWVTVTDASGQATTVDKSFGYRRDDNGRLRIVLHHSSFPFQPGA